ncbi:MAG TPA: hypothetical protein VFB49_12805 [Patescibacteria group bacterium]|nr:hypothetical protein [Patescibacteria group bacterium]
MTPPSRRSIARPPRVWPAILALPALFVLAAFLVLAAPARAGTVTSNPVPLQDGSCPGIAASDGSTAHALYEYQITQTGAIQGIKLLYADVQPPDRRTAFLAQTQACLGGWRFRPATVDGTPAATLMKAAFHRLPPAPRNGPEVLLPGGHVVSLTLLDQIRAATLKFTETLLTGRGYLEARGKGWFLRTDLPKSALDDLQRTLDFAKEAFTDAFPGGTEPAASQDVTIILFKDQEKYQQLAAFDNLVPERSPVAGHYNPQVRIIYAAQGNQPMPIFARVIAHEATHHFAQLRLARPNEYLPRWLNEGTAMFVESIKMAKPGKVRLDALDRGDVTQPAALITRDGTASGAWMWRKTVENALPLLAENLGDYDIGALVDGRLDQYFFDNSMQVQYAVSWLLVHTLLTGEAGRYREAFRAWAAGAGATRDATTLGAALGIPMPDLHRAMEKHLKEIQ